jgi:hypothetical protein
MWVFKQNKRVRVPKAEPATIVTCFHPARLMLALGKLRERPDEDLLKVVIDSLKANVELLKDANLTLWHSMLIAATEAAKVVSDQFNKAQTELLAAEARFAETPAPHFHAVLFMLLFASLAILGEYSLTVSTLPGLLSIEPRSLLGLVLGALPLSAAKCLEPAMRRLRSLHEMLIHAARFLVRFLAYTIEALVLVSVIVANGIMVTHLAQARDEAVNITNALEAAADGTAADEEHEQQPKIDKDVTYKAIVSVSVVIILDAVIFFLLLDDELVLWSLRRSAKRQLKRAGKTARRKGHELLDIEHQRQCAQYVYESRHERVNAIGQAELSKRLAELYAMPVRKAPSLENVLDDLVLANIPKPRLTVVK